MSELQTAEAIVTSHERELTTSGEVVISVISEEIGPSPEAFESAAHSPEVAETVSLNDPLFADPTPLPELTELPFDTAEILPDQHVALIVPGRNLSSVPTTLGSRPVDGIVAHARGLELAIQDDGRHNLELAA